MKKKMIALLAGALMTLSASSAFAAFADLSLVRVVYQGSTNLEVATDLGNVNDLALTTNNVVGGGADAFTSITGSATDLYVAYFAKLTTVPLSPTNLWLSTSDTSSPLVQARKYSTVDTTLGNVLDYYNTIGGTTVQVGKSDSSSFYVVSELTGNGIGSYARVTETNYLNTTDLAALATQGYVDSVLYSFNANVAGAGTQAMIIRTMADGSTIINPQDAAPVPIPAAAYLLGSGLLGLVGIRRKAKK